MLQLVDVLTGHAERHPTSEAFAFLADGETPSTTLKYFELDRKARALAARLLDMKMRGERALLVFPAGLEFVVAFFATQYAGVTAGPIYPPKPHGRATTFLSCVHDAAPRVILTTDRLIGRLQALIGDMTD